MAQREPSAKKEKINDKENERPKFRRKSKLNDRWIGTKETENLTTKYVPRNTVTSTKWAITTFEGWKKSRNAHFCSNHTAVQ